MKEEGPEILKLTDVLVDPSSTYDTGLSCDALVIEEGDLALVLVETGLYSIPLGDLAMGLVTPERGKVEFRGHDWRNLAAEAAVKLRGRIGRTFEWVGWLSNLDVDENIMLPQRYHTNRSEEEIAAEADAMARALGMDGIPMVRPSMLTRRDLRRAEWVRAFIGRPDLIVLERPTRNVPADWIPLLVARVDAARARGAAVIWITGRHDEWQHAHSKATFKYAIRDASMIQVSGEEK